MDLHQRELRRAAAEAFIESLDKLQETLCSAENQPNPPAPEAIAQPPAKAPEPSKPPIEINLDTLEQAVADIEQFMQAKEE
jgi:hypothetical protein